MCLVEAVVVYKRELKDPEGEAILNHLVLKRGFDKVKKIRSGKYLLFEVNTESPDEAVEYVKNLCDKLRLYNPAIHEVVIRVAG